MPGRRDGDMKKTADQEFLRSAQDALGYSAADMADVLEVSWNTYKAWLYGQLARP